MFKKLISINNYDKFLRKVSIIVFWGSVWGILEATLGYLLHKINFSFGWCIWFPLAFYFMNKIYKKTGKAQYMVYGALITSTIKLTNLFIEVRIDKVVNPAVSIVLEALALLIFCKVLEKNNKKPSIISIASLNILWRCFYAGYILLMPEPFLAISPLRGVNPLLKFMILESIVNTSIILAYIAFSNKLSRKIQEKNIKSFNMNPITSLLMFALAIFVQLNI